MGAVLGLLGGGGSILTVPILAYVAGMPPAEAIAASLVVVTVTSAVGATMHARAGAVQWRTGLLFGGVAMVGAYGGGRLAVFVPGWLLLALFAGLMVVTAVMMLRKKSEAKKESSGAQAGTLVIAAEGLVVGAVTGLVGAGGGFLVVPALVILGGLSMRHAIGTSLLVIAMKSSAGVVGHLSHVDIDWTVTGLIAAFAVVGSIVGTNLSAKVPAKILRVVFAYFVLVMGLMILSKELARFVPSALVYGFVGASVVSIASFALWQYQRSKQVVHRLPLAPSKKSTFKRTARGSIAERDLDEGTRNAVVAALAFMPPPERPTSPGPRS